jgi:hypothetical protein
MLAAADSPTPPPSPLESLKGPECRTVMRNAERQILFGGSSTRAPASGREPKSATAWPRSSRAEPPPAKLAEAHVPPAKTEPSLAEGRPSWDDAPLPPRKVMRSQVNVEASRTTRHSRRGRARARGPVPIHRGPGRSLMVREECNGFNQRIQLTCRP